MVKVMIKATKTKQESIFAFPLVNSKTHVVYE